MKSIPSLAPAPAKTYLVRLLRASERPGLASYERGSVVTRKAFNRHLCALVALVDLHTQEGAVITGFTADLEASRTDIE